MPVRTARRWRERYRGDGLIGLADGPRFDGSVRRTRGELITLIEGLALRRPALPVAHIHRETTAVAQRYGWPAPSYGTVYAIVRALDPGLLALAHDGPARSRERFELVYRRESDAPNAIWQADHTQLDLLVLDATGAPARPWLTVIEDDHSRAVVGYTRPLNDPCGLIPVHEHIQPPRSPGSHGRRTRPSHMARQRRRPSFAASTSGP